MTEVDDSVSFTLTGDDADLAANALVGGFEAILLEWIFGGSTFLVGSGNLDHAMLLAIFGGPGVFNVEARVTDKIGAMSSFFLDVTVSVPEPGLLALALPSIAALVRRARRRRPVR